MFAAIVVGLVAGAIHFGTGIHKAINLEKSFLGAFLGRRAIFALTFILPPFDYPRALFGGISLLVPAMVITIGVHQLANEALESGTVRLIYGMACFALLAAGLAAAFAIGHLLGVTPPQSDRDQTSRSRRARVRRRRRPRAGGLPPGSTA